MPWSATRDETLELNTKGRYAVMAMADLAKHGGGAAEPLSAIAERQDLPIAYLEQIFSRLRKAGLVDSARGRSGGYRLTRPAANISIGEVMLAVEEDTKLTRCEIGAAGCVKEKRCLTHSFWSALQSHIEAFLGQVTLEDVVAGEGFPPVVVGGLQRVDSSGQEMVRDD